MIRRLPGEVPVRKPDADGELLRIVASAANETVDALDLPAPKVAHALSEVVARYARTLQLTTRIVQDALRDAMTAASGDGGAMSAGRADVSEASAGEVAAGSDEDVAPDASPASPAPEAPPSDRDQHG
jgi:non-specific serine/threonine protein kinase